MMIRYLRPWFSFCLILLCFCFFSCNGSDIEKAVDLSVFENIQSGGQWAVLSEPYVAYREFPDPSSIVQAHGRLGDVAQVTGKSLVSNKDTDTTVLWYQFTYGFVPESSVILYTNRLQAENAARMLMSDKR